MVFTTVEAVEKTTVGWVQVVRATRSQSCADEASARLFLLDSRKIHDPVCFPGLSAIF
jgi:hypothetical protein